MSSLFALGDPALVATLVGIIFVSAILQTTTGFGFAILSAPILTAILGGPETVSLIIMCGTAVDILVLIARRQQRSAPDWSEAGVLVISSIPGLLCGAWLLTVIAPRALLIVVACAVILAVVHRLWSRVQTGRGGTVGRGWGVVAGLTSGTLATSTTLAGPPTVLYLTRRMSDPGRLRDTLVLVNLLRLPISVGALVVTGSFQIPAGVAWPVLAACAGYLVGSVLFRRLNAQRYDVVVLAVLTLAAAVALTVAFL
ncbi:MAG: sulfite exporter TauE/SafE family protein [Mycetocola sp.]